MLLHDAVQAFLMDLPGFFDAALATLPMPAWGTSCRAYREWALRDWRISDVHQAKCFSVNLGAE